ncbi:MAG: zinc ribbon domain-containing protein [Terracidiphilus sp.]
MSDVRCPHCGGTNDSNAAFCGTCGTPLATQQPQPPSPPASNQPQTPGAYAPPPPGAIPAPPGVYPPPPGVYPPMGPGANVTGQNTKWAIGLGIAALFCCGPFTAIPGLFLAKKDMDDFASGRAPYLNESSAKLAFYLNVGALILSAIGILFFWGRGFRAL